MIISKVNPIILATLIVACESVWFYLNLDRGSFRYPLFKLYNATNKTWTLPKSLFNYTQIWRQPEDYIETTSNQQRLYHYIAAGSNLIAMPLDQIYMSKEDAIQAGLPTTNQTLCKQQLDWIQGEVSSTNGTYFAMIGREANELTRFMDSYGRPESGFFSLGKDIWPGQYVQCQQASLNQGKIKGRYCLGRYTMQDWPSGPSQIDPDPAIRIAVCLPETCDSLSIDQNRNTIDLLVKQQIPDNLKSILKLENLFCLPDERSPMRKLSGEGKALINIICMWISLYIIMNCIYEFLLRRKSKKSCQNGDIAYIKKNIDDNNGLIKLLTGMTLRNSVKSLKIRRSISPDERVDMSCLNFVKIMMTFGIIISHSMILSIYKSRSKIGNLNLSISDSAKFFYSFGRFVDTFLILFGLIMSFTLLQKFRLKQLTNPFLWISTNIAILLRIMPIHTLIILFNRWITPLIGSGPWWDYGLDNLSYRKFCKISSLNQIIPQLVNYENIIPVCNAQAWFLGPYTQVAFFIPLVSYIIFKLPNQFARVIFVAIMSLISAANVSIRLFNQEVVPAEAIGDYGAFMVGVVEKFETTGYMDTLSRFGSIMIGCYSGYLLYLFQINKIKEWPKWFSSRLFNLLIILVHIALFLMPILGDKLQTNQGNQNGPKLSTLQFAMINLVLIPLWPIINCCLILTACTNYKNHVVVRFMAHPIWNSASKLCLGIYLIHFDVLISSLTFYEYAPPNGHPFEVLKLAGFCSVVSILLALMVYIFLEAPIAYISAKYIMPTMVTTGTKQEYLPELSCSGQESIDLNDKFTFDIRNKSQQMDHTSVNRLKL